MFPNLLQRSTKPQGMSNQMFFALVAYGLALILQLQMKTKKKRWQFLRLMRTYMYKPYDAFTEAVFRRKSKTTRGQQKIPIRKTTTMFEGTIAMIKPQKRNK
ncbi:hypothetical protein BN1058_00198 [Paraliobacillus sp. PM-2]|uniref:hypothetical protein n=1 Tax=Paraliobacillus sp. PM-2 TaxID=1462524 RepID=UPI00061C57C8|nr:hypothetical protein [Paraliobacillus sp. PM-2]CQR45956.1 hypothetical protein BN1058_00198 [Paraliobacillus sp. PM-2]